MQGFRYLGRHHDSPRLFAFEGVGEPRHRPAGPPQCPTALRGSQGHHSNRSGWSRESFSVPKLIFGKFSKTYLFLKNDKYHQYSASGSQKPTHVLTFIPRRSLLWNVKKSYSAWLDWGGLGASRAQRSDGDTSCHDFVFL